MTIEIDRPQMAQLAVAAIAILAFNALRFHFHWEMPAWADWITIAIIAAVGLIVAVKPRGTPYLRPSLARAAGVSIVLIAATSAYLQFSSK